MRNKEKNEGHDLVIHSHQFLCGDFTLGLHRSYQEEEMPVNSSCDFSSAFCPLCKCVDVCVLSLISGKSGCLDKHHKLK